jgi:drug/metabolite transporter (DMT)-like permease
MNWLLVALLAPLLWASSSYIDKLLISKYFKGGTGALIIYSCLIGLPVFLLIAIFKPAVLSVSLASAVLVTINGFVYILYLFPYLKALNKTDTSLVIPIFQTIPIFTYFLAFFILGERLSGMQIFGSLLIISGAAGISLKYENKKLSFGKDVLFLMLLSSFILSLNYLFFKFFAIDLDFWTVSFWQYLL